MSNSNAGTLLDKSKLTLFNEYVGVFSTKRGIMYHAVVVHACVVYDIIYCLLSIFRSTDKALRLEG